VNADQIKGMGEPEDFSSTLEKRGINRPQLL